MSGSPSHSHESDDLPSATSATKETPKSENHPWVTYVAIAACVIIFVGLAARNDYKSWDTISKFGVLPAASIWNGAYWALISTAFVHFAIWHVAFNLYWLWHLGSRLELAMGSLPFVVFFVVAAFVSSSFQLALSGSTGIGASGVVYAIFGFMWAVRRQYSQFDEVLDERTIQIFVVWMLGCVVATVLKVWQVGNAAHISGLLFGAAVAGSFYLHVKPRLMLTSLVALVVLSIVPLSWCPWSVDWLSHKAYEEHVARRYDAALHRYNQIIRREPKNAWAYVNRSDVYRVLGQSEKAEADLRKAHELEWFDKK